MEHIKVYPFTVSLPRYASWRNYAQALLKQLKACPACRGAADGFPVSILPKTHKLPNGKLLVFKGVTSAATDLGALCTNNEVVEEYDMFSIDPNCPKHGKYSRTAWLRKQRSGGVKVNRPVSKARNQNQQNAIDHKTDGFSRSLCKPDTKPVFVLKERELNGQMQLVVSTRKVAALGKDLKYLSPILVPKQQLNTLSVCDQDKDFVSRRPKCGPHEMTGECGPVLEREEDVLKCEEESYASRFRKMCLLKKTYQDKKLLERVAKMDREFQTVPSHQENDRVEPLELGELQQSSLVERLNRIANAAKALQAGLRDHRADDEATRVQLAQAQVGDSRDEREWMLDTAIENTVNKIIPEGSRVRHLVQALESIKAALVQH